MRDIRQEAVSADPIGGGRAKGVQATCADDGLDDLRIMLTATEAFPYLEDLFLTARTQISASFRIFDPQTRLLSEKARSVGEDWADLVAHTLARGVRVSLVLSDFDPVGAPELHVTTHRSLRDLAKSAERSGAPEFLEAVAHRHPAEAGPIWRLLAAPLARRKLARTAAHLTAQGAEKADETLANAPGLAPLLRPDGTGGWCPKRGILPRLAPCSHHQKLAVADGSHLYIGGLDLDERRRDGLHHNRPADRTWHDVVLGVTGPVAGQAEAHLAAFRSEIDGTARPSARPGLLRTLSGRRRGLGRLRIGPRPLVAEIQDRTLAEITRTTQLVYLETQFLRDTRFARALAARARQMPDLQLIVVLPAAPDEVAFLDDGSLGQRFGEHMQAKCINILERAFGGRALFVAPAQPRPAVPDGTRALLCGAPIVYVHAKVSVFDERAAVVSSANLNGRSHRWDTEAGIALEVPTEVQLLRERLFQHWLPEGVGQEFFAPESAPQAWRRLSEENADRQPEDRRGFLLPYPKKAPRRFGRPVPFLPQEMV